VLVTFRPSGKSIVQSEARYGRRSELFFDCIRHVSCSRRVIISVISAVERGILRALVDGVEKGVML